MSYEVRKHWLRPIRIEVHHCRPTPEHVPSLQLLLACCCLASAHGSLATAKAGHSAQCIDTHKQDLSLTSTLKVQTRKGCLFRVLLVCRVTSERGNFCKTLLARPCINCRGEKPSKAFALHFLRRAVRPGCRCNMHCMRHALFFEDMARKPYTAQLNCLQAYRAMCSAFKLACC